MYFETKDLSTPEYLYSFNFARLRYLIYTILASVADEVKTRRQGNERRLRKESQSKGVVQTAAGSSSNKEGWGNDMQESGEVHAAGRTKGRDDLVASFPNREKKMRTSLPNALAFQGSPLSLLLAAATRLQMTHVASTLSRDAYLSYGWDDENGHRFAHAKDQSLPLFGNRSRLKMCLETRIIYCHRSKTTGSTSPFFHARQTTRKMVEAHVADDDAQM